MPRYTEPAHFRVKHQGEGYMLPIIELLNAPKGDFFVLTRSLETDAPQRTVSIRRIAMALQSELAQQLQIDKATILVTKGSEPLTDAAKLVIRVSHIDRTDDLTHDKLARITESLYNTTRELTEQKISVTVLFDRLHDPHNDIRFPK